MKLIKKFGHYVMTKYARLLCFLLSRHNYKFSYRHHVPAGSGNFLHIETYRCVHCNKLRHDKVLQERICQLRVVEFIVNPIF